MSTQELTIQSILNDLSLPTLEEISVVKIATQLMKHEEIKKIYCEHFLAEKREENFPHSMLVSKLKSICELLQLPDILEAKVMSCCHSMRRQYFNWIQEFARDELQNAFPKKIDYITHVMNSVKWSMEVIEKEKSIHQLYSLENIKDDNILNDMFVIASRFCLKDDLKILWKKMSRTEKKKLVADCEGHDFITYYWVCKMRRNLRPFMNGIFNHLKSRNYLEADIDFKDPCNYALILYIFQGDISGVKHFNKSANVDIECKVDIIRRFLKEVNNEYKNWLGYSVFRNFFDGLNRDQCANKVFFLLKEIEDESILETIFCEFFKVFLKISVKCWRWHKFFFPLLRMFNDRIDHILIYDLITQILEDVEIEKADLFEVEMLWEIIPNEVKKSFCSYISKEQDDRDFVGFWGNMTAEVFKIFLKDEKYKYILTPYKNEGIIECIYNERYDLVDFWLQKCLESEEAITTYMKNFIKTKFAELVESFKYYSMSPSLSSSRINKFVDWALKYQNLMSGDEILELKDYYCHEYPRIALPRPSFKYKGPRAPRCGQWQYCSSDSDSDSN